MAATTPSIPVVPGLPFLGRFPEFRRDRLALYEAVYREGGGIAGVNVGWIPLILVTDAELVREVLIDRAADYEKDSHTLDALRPGMGNGLLTSDNAFHKRQRKLVTPAFQYRNIISYAQTMTEHAERLQDAWADGDTIDVAREMMRLTMWIVGKVLFNVDLLHEAGPIGDALTVMQHWSIARLTAVARLPANWPTPANRRMKQAIARLDQTIYRIIAERRASQEDPGDLLSTLLAARDEDDGSFMTNKQVRDEAMTLFLAGHETTSNALSWTWYLLTQHPDIYAGVRAEADTVLGGRRPTVTDLPNLPYTLQVLKEAMRLYPPAYVLGRQSVRDTTVGGYPIPQGRLIIIPQWVMHRRADYFPDPLRFDPERFTPENEAKLPRFAYLPFGAGPRVCIGNQFAMMEAHLLLATLVQRVTFEFVPGQTIEPEPLVTLRPKYGVKMRVHRRAVVPANTMAKMETATV